MTYYTTHTPHLSLRGKYATNTVVRKLKERRKHVSQPAEVLRYHCARNAYAAPDCHCEGAHTPHRKYAANTVARRLKE